MDVGYTYASQRGDRVAVYAPPGFEPADVLVLANDQTDVEFLRVSDRELGCGTVPGVKGACDSHECHRRQLGVCQCGRHERVAIRRAS